MTARASKVSNLEFITPITDEIIVKLENFFEEYAEKNKLAGEQFAELELKMKTMPAPGKGGYGSSPERSDRGRSLSHPKKKNHGRFIASEFAKEFKATGKVPFKAGHSDMLAKHGPGFSKKL